MTEYAYLLKLRPTQARDDDIDKFITLDHSVALKWINEPYFEGDYIKCLTMLRLIKEI